MIIFQARDLISYISEVWNFFFKVIFRDPIKTGLTKTLVIYAFYYLS